VVDLIYQKYKLDTFSSVWNFVLCRACVLLREIAVYVPCISVVVNWWQTTASTQKNYRSGLILKSCGVADWYLATKPEVSCFKDLELWQAIAVKKWSFESFSLRVWEVGPGDKAIAVLGYLSVKPPWYSCFTWTIFWLRGIPCLRKSSN